MPTIGREPGSRWWCAEPKRLQQRNAVLAEIGRATLRLRLYRGWKQRDVERATGIDQTTISRLERGQHPGLSIGRLGAVLDAHRVGELTFEPRAEAPPTDLERMLLGDPWRRAGQIAERRLARQRRQRGSRATISTRPPSEPIVSGAARRSQGEQPRA
jgi:transcriptional regulator with XRE-family HTH domain